MVSITKMWRRDKKWANIAGKMMLIDFLDPELPQMVNLLKKYSIFQV